MLLDAVFFLLQAGLDLFWWAILLAAIVQTLLSFNVLDGRNKIVWTIADFLYRITEPALRPVRNRLPNLGGIDLSPLVVLLLITALGIALSAIRGYLLRSGLYF
jgi:YggT family protein